MAQTPKRRKLPKNTVKKTSGEVAEKLFGKRVKAALDKASVPTSKPHNDSISGNA